MRGQVVRGPVAAGQSPQASRLQVNCLQLSFVYVWTSKRDFAGQLSAGQLSVGQIAVGQTLRPSRLRANRLLIILGQSLFCRPLHISVLGVDAEGAIFEEQKARFHRLQLAKPFLANLFL